MVRSIRTNRKFTRYPDSRLPEFGSGVKDGLTNNLSLPEPPVTPAELTVLINTFNGYLAKGRYAGRLNTSGKKAARLDLVVALNKDASYVDIACNGDLTILLSSGFLPVSTNRAQTVLSAPQVLAVEYGQKGELKPRVKADLNAKSFVGRIKEVGGSEYGPSISFPNSRAILFRGLKSGLEYMMQLCAIGGSTGQSDWSEPVTKMAL